MPINERARVTAFVVSCGMACSVYAAQYLLEALFQNGASDAAHAPIVTPGDRSWKHMVERGTAITWEAWDQKYKPNQDWNHAWGAAPANLFPNYVLGARVLAPAGAKPSSARTPVRSPAPMENPDPAWLVSHRLEKRRHLQPQRHGPRRHLRPP